MAKNGDTFVKGCAKVNNIRRRRRIRFSICWTKIRGYGFNKAHAAKRRPVAYQDRLFEGELSASNFCVR